MPRSQEDLQEMYRQQEHMRRVQSHQRGDIRLPSTPAERPKGLEQRKAALLKALGTK